MKNRKNLVAKGEKNSIISRVQDMTNKFRNITGNKEKCMDSEEMRLERSEELNPDDFE